MAGKIIPKLLYAVVALGGFISLYALVTQPNFGLTMANIPTYAMALTLVMFGSVKAFGFDLVKTVSVA